MRRLFHGVIIIQRSERRPRRNRECCCLLQHSATLVVMAEGLASWGTFGREPHGEAVRYRPDGYGIWPGGADLTERMAYVNGFVPESAASISIFDRGVQLGHGIYER